MDDNHKFALAHMIDTLQIGERFTKWPLHITLLPWFYCGDNLVETISRIETIIVNMQPFGVSVGEDAMFGPEHDVPVMLLSKSEELTKLHARIYHQLVISGCRLESEEYSRANLKPHITVRGDRNIANGTRVIIDSIDLVENLQDGKMGRKVVRRFNFSAPS